ncbi:LysM peptidoglycan-binding domain-containing protein [Pyxidicoccus fallax]|uniref:LysM peptidoglycan-binding domain-containing protein n=1 Tax=Pyxidicoccus fallax TaxID=394095 RepID=A0A848LFL8_9BACT|nr:peptidoglycan-binding protein [Pyxidicoccus fallax]NMO15131.1 LysM peptidoglycan-binding domain-containing protein [Pyxidicoccus fallax]NPC77477.1 LysM peptidoglycan-binding domain-containing protein [Pyxidicoccus fallax]
MPKLHTVRQGECLASIAQAYGFFLDTLWQHPSNARLRQERRDPYVLRPGDQVTIPDLRPRQVSCRTGATHRFKLRGVPEKLRLRLLSEGEPRRHVPYVLVVDGCRELHGETDADGWVEQWIPPNAQEGELRLGEDEVYPLRLARLLPVEDDEGLKARLGNLGHLHGDDADALHAAIADFQRQHGLPSTGEADDTTRARVREIHGS